MIWCLRQAQKRRKINKMVDDVSKALAVKELIATKVDITQSSTVLPALVLTGTNDGSGSTANSYALVIQNTGDGGAARFSRTETTDTKEAIVYIVENSAGTDEPCIEISNAGVGGAIKIDDNAATAAPASINIDKDVGSSAVTEYGLKIACDVTAGGGAGAGIDLSSFTAGEISINFVDGNASALNPSAVAESGWINIGVGGTVKYIPYYDAS